MLKKLLFILCLTCIVACKDKPIVIAPVKAETSIQVKKTISVNEPQKKKNILVKKSSLIKPVKTIVLPPKIKYLSFTMTDANKNGKADPGEKINLKVCVQNIGKGIGEELSVKITTNKIIPSLEEISIWPVQPGETKCFPMDFWVPSKAEGLDIVKLYFSEGAKAEIKVAISSKPKTAQQNIVATEKERIKQKAQKAFDELN